MMKSRAPLFMVWAAGLAAALITLRVAVAEPKPAPVSGEWLLGKGAMKEGPIGPGIIWLDEATKARNSAAGGGAASVGSAEALIFHQPHDSGFGFFEKTYETGGFPMWACRMEFGNGWEPGDSISSYELKIFHSSSDDINLGGADYRVELWDGDPFSILETVCTTGGVSAPIPGTQAIIADVPYAAVIQARVELPAKVVYDCDRVWMGMTSLTGCRSAWRISGVPGDSFSAPPDLGLGNGLWLFTGCESSTFGFACPTQTGLGVGFCCGSRGSCSVSGSECRFNYDCPVGETCEGQKVCNHGQTYPWGFDFLIPCGSPPPVFSPWASECGSGFADHYIADLGLRDTERGYVGSIFAATDTTMSIVPVSVDAPPGTAGSGAGVISLTGDEVILEGGGHNVWLEVMIGDWGPHTLRGYQPALDFKVGSVSGVQGQLTIYTGSVSCGVCDECPGGDCVAGICEDSVVGPPGRNTGLSCTGADVLCEGSYDCTAGTCSGKHCSDDGADCVDDADCAPGTCEEVPCHIPLRDCTSGETCIHASICVPNDDPSTFLVNEANALCEAALGEGSTCGPPGYLAQEPDGPGLSEGLCSWTYTDVTDQRWALAIAQETLAALDVSTFDARPAYAVSTGPAVPSFPPFPKYAATLAVHVPADAKGTFTIDLKPSPASTLSSGAGPNMPLLGTVPAKITIQTGRCCFNLQDVTTGGEGCLDGNQTVGSCADLPGVTVFEANGSCDDPCPPVCGDGLLDQNEECDDGLVGNSDTLPDACRSDCTLPSCGDGVHDTGIAGLPGGEECDEGDGNSDTTPDACRTDCTVPICGDGVRDMGVPGSASREACDGTDDASCPGRCADDCTCETDIPATTHWGLMALALLLLTGAKLYPWRDAPLRPLLGKEESPLE